tara:strand:- start:4 stop:411 length:408 start_codon:yes stop_codon:yes gene_type:complete
VPFATLLPSILPLVGDVLDRFFPNKEEKEKALREVEARLVDHLARIDLAQIEVNRQEAGHRTIFVAGWRPFIGWSCGLALFYTYLAQPVLTFVLVQQGQYVDLPPVDLGAMMPVLLGILGLGGLRSWEKYKGISK